MTFEKGQTVYRISGHYRDEVTQHEIERVTKTSVFITHRGREERYSRDSGNPIPRDSGFLSPGIVEHTPAMYLRYVRSARMRVAEALETAARTFRRGVNGARPGMDPSTINDLIEEWTRVNVAVAEAEKGQGDA